MDVGAHRPAVRARNGSRAASVSSRRFLGEVMAAIDALAFDLVGPIAPDRDDVVPARHAASLAPQGLNGAGDAPAGLLVGFVERESIPAPAR